MNNQPYKSTTILKVVSVLAVAFFIVTSIIALFGEGNQPKVEERNLGAWVLNQGDYFIIRNNDSFNWGDCDIDLNDDYSINHISIPTSNPDNMVIPASEFADKHGKRYNPMEMKAQTIFI